MPEIAQFKHRTATVALQSSVGDPKDTEVFLGGRQLT